MPTFRDLDGRFIVKIKDNTEIVNFSSIGELIIGEIKKFRESFREAVKRINNWIEEDQINQVVEKLTRPQPRYCTLS